MPAWVWKVLFNRIIPRVIDEFKRRRDWKKIDEYVNKPNELDKQMKQVYKNSCGNSKNIEVLEKEVAILKRDSHPRSDWICLDCGCKAKKIEKSTRKRRKRKIKKGD